MLALPGIGKSTAAAILSLADNQAYIILDGNVKRVLARYFAIDGWPGNKKVEDSMWQLAESLKPQARFNHYTQAMMDLGATLCTRSKPKCESCPVQSHCLAYAQGQQALFPHKKPKKQIPTKTTRMLIPFYNGRVLLHKRPASGIWGGLWGFYETDCTADNTPELLGELNTKTQLASPITNSTMQPLAEFKHTFSHFHLLITPVLVNLEQAPVQNVSEQGESEQMWVDIHAPSNVGLAAPTVKIFKQLTSMF